MDESRKAHAPWRAENPGTRMQGPMESQSHGQCKPCRIAILYASNRDAKRKPGEDANPFLPLFRELSNLGVDAQAAVYDDGCRDEIKRQLSGVDGVLVWVNPIEDGHDRRVLDAMLRDVSASGVFVSTHPDIILKLGTKEVLYRTRNIGWGCDTHLYLSPEQLAAELPLRLANGDARVLKQYRGNGGNGVWKVELAEQGAASVSGETMVRARHAKRGCTEEIMPLCRFLESCEAYFTGEGRIIDQAYQARLPEGIIRCYLVHDRVEGFGHQAVNALYPALPGAPPGSAPQAGPRLYHPPSKPEFQSLKRQLELEWVPAMQRLLDVKTVDLPVLWDCDFLLGPRNSSGEDTYVLCEINVSCVTPFPDPALPFVARAALARAQSRKQERT